MEQRQVACGRAKDSCQSPRREEGGREDGRVGEWMRRKGESRKERSCEGETEHKKKNRERMNMEMEGQRQIR